MTYYLVTSNIMAPISGVIWQEWPRTPRPRNGGRLWNPSSGRCQRAKLANGGQKWRRFFTWIEPLALDLWQMPTASERMAGGLTFIKLPTVALALLTEECPAPHRNPRI